jgi:hypothetical protein
MDSIEHENIRDYNQQLDFISLLKKLSGHTQTGSKVISKTSSYLFFKMRALISQLI